MNKAPYLQAILPPASIVCTHREVHQGKRQQWDNGQQPGQDETNSEDCSECYRHAFNRVHLGPLLVECLLPFGEGNEWRKMKYRLE